MIFGGVRSGGRKLTDAGSMAGIANASMSRKRTPSAPSRIRSATSPAWPAANGTRPCSVSAPTCCFPLIAKVASFISFFLVESVGDGAAGFARCSVGSNYCSGSGAAEDPYWRTRSSPMPNPGSQAPEPSVDDQGLPGHEGRIVGCEERRNTHQIGHLATARDGLQLREKGDLVFGRGPAGPASVRVHHAVRARQSRCHCIDGDAVRSVLAGERPRHADQPGFARHVVDETRDFQADGVGSDVDDSSVAPFLHRGDEPAAKKGWGFEVDRHQRAPGAEIDVLELDI